MKTYFVAQIKITDENEYNKYLARCDEVFSKCKGKYIVLDNSPELLEGEWNYTRMVIIQFNSKDDFTKWYYSDAYQQILKYRKAGSFCNTVLVKGIENI